MAELIADTKHSMGYTASSGSTDSTTRLISGLNFGSSSAPNLGPNILPAFSNIYDALHRFSNGIIGNLRWIREQEVVL